MPEVEVTEHFHKNLATTYKNLWMWEEKETAWRKLGEGSRFCILKEIIMLYTALIKIIDGFN